MALYSVWNWDRNSYDVYEDRQPVSIGDDPNPPRPSKLHAIGAVPDRDVKSLPSGTRLVGQSPMPKGEIVRKGGGGFFSVVTGGGGGGSGDGLGDAGAFGEMTLGKVVIIGLCIFAVGTVIRDDIVRAPKANRRRSSRRA
jgi:hypothetical protein